MDRIKPVNFSLLIFFWLVLFFLPFSSHATTTLRVGVYQNHPKVFLNTDNTPGGIFIDILQYAAKKEKWELEYVSGTFFELMQMLEEGSIDILPDVAYSEERSLTIRFNNINVLSSWLQIYSFNDKQNLSFNDLQGYTISVLQGSVQEFWLRHEFPVLFGFKPEILSLPDYEATQNALINGQADALLASRFYFFSSNRPAEIKPTQMIFRPSVNLFGFSPICPAAIRNRLDSHIADLQNSPKSIYYQSMERWFHQKPAGFNLPVWLTLLTAMVGVSLVAGLIITLIRTFQMQRSYQEIFNSVSDAIMIHDATNGQIIDGNQSALQMYGYDNINEISSVAILSAEDAGYTQERALKAIHQAARDGFNQFEWLARHKDGHTFWAEVSLKSANILGKPRILAMAHDIAQRKRHEEQLQKSVDDKNILMQELHHRTRNNMQIICALMNLQAGLTGSQALIQAFGETENRIMAMALVHEKL
ncbi:MAG: PAS domain S-box protein, partial [Spirochaetaceae bacterium]